MKTEWHVFTKDGNEYSDSRIKFEGRFVILFRLHKAKYTTEVRDWRFLGLKWKEIRWSEDVETYDYMFHELEILRIERHDVSEKDVGV